MAMTEIPVPMLVVMLKVWDLGFCDGSDEPTFTKELRCECSRLDIEIALTEYADEDVDGLNEGFYDSGGEFLVQVDDGPQVPWRVHVEAVPSFSACPAKPKAVARG